MATVVVNKTVDEAGLRALLEPRDEVAAEKRLNETTFGLESGPFDHYERTVAISRRDDGTYDVEETTDFQMAIPVWRGLFTPLLKRSIKHPPKTDRPPWWSPPDRLDARAARTLSYLGVFSAITGYLGTLLSQTNTYFRKDFGASVADITPMLTGVRLAGLLAFATMALADRRGRKWVLLVATYAAIVLTSTGALAPNLLGLGISQTASRGFSAAIGIVIAIIAVEEMPAGSRAFAVSVLTMSAALGAGGVVLFLGLADLTPWAWRVFYAVPLLMLPAVVALGRRLPESRRFEVYEMRELLSRASVSGEGIGAGLTGLDGTDSRAEPGTGSAIAVDDGPGRSMRTHIGRLVLLGSVGFLTFLFLVPSGQYLNDFLRTGQGYSGVQITLFQVLTTLPAGVAIVAGGRLADVFGRRIIGSIGVGGGALFTVLMFTGNGWAIWLWSTVGTILAALAVPALAVYGPELFPTKIRGLANGTINVLQVIGAVAGILLVGRFADAVGYGQPLALLGLGPLVVVAIILIFYPETAHKRLEDINPEDEPPPESLDDLVEMEHELDELEHEVGPLHGHEHGHEHGGEHGAPIPSDGSSAEAESSEPGSAGPGAEAGTIDRHR
ncbi:MAG: MFS transporter [Actinobacteria bacterium]|nr:MFS transporter [Actinomycetota bacterium]